MRALRNRGANPMAQGQGGMGRVRYSVVSLPLHAREWTNVRCVCGDAACGGNSEGIAAGGMWDAAGGK